MANNQDLADICPLCGKSNNCAMADNANASECWCMQEQFPDKAAVMSRVETYTPDTTQVDAAFDQRCICVACLRKLQQQ